MNETQAEHERPETATQFMLFRLTIVLAAALQSALHAILVLLRYTGRQYDAIETVLAVATLFLSWRYWLRPNRRILIGVVVLVSAEFVFFVFKLVSAEYSMSLRLLPVTIIVLYGATVMALLLTSVRILDPLKALSLSFSLAVGILLSETTIRLLLDSLSATADGSPEWVGNTDPHPSLGVVYRPYSALKAYYPDNPRRYFDEEDGKESKRWLRVGGGGVANLVFPPNEPDAIRIAIEKAKTKIGFDIQLNQSHLKVKANHSYAVDFRARADSPRSIFVGFARANAPWSNLGLYRKMELTSAWQNFRGDFVATDDDDNGRIHFDVGESDISVELASVSLRSIPDGELIEPDLPPQRYFVSYKFNALGCRGRDYSIPPPTGTVRRLLHPGSRCARGRYRWE
jgi:hypothetical protein